MPSPAHARSVDLGRLGEADRPGPLMEVSMEGSIIPGQTMALGQGLEPGDERSESSGAAS